MYNVGGTGQIKEEYILFLKVHFPTNVFYNLIWKKKNLLMGSLFKKISSYLEELVEEKKS